MEIDPGSGGALVTHKKRNNKDVDVRKCTMVFVSLAMVVMMLSVPMLASAGFVNRYAPFQYGSAVKSETRTDTRDDVCKNRWDVNPWARLSDGHFGTEASSDFWSETLYGQSATTTGTIYFGASFVAPSTKSYVAAYYYQFNWHIRLHMEKYASYPCNGIARGWVYFGQKVFDVTTGAYLGLEKTVMLADYSCTWASSPVDQSGSYGSMGFSWNLVSGHTYVIEGRIYSCTSIYSGGYPSMVYRAWADTDVWRSGDPYLNYIQITWQ